MAEKARGEFILEVIGTFLRPVFIVLAVFWLGGLSFLCETEIRVRHLNWLTREIMLYVTAL